MWANQIFKNRSLGALLGARGVKKSGAKQETNGQGDSRRMMRALKMRMPHTMAILRLSATLAPIAIICFFSFLRIQTSKCNTVIFWGDLYPRLRNLWTVPYLFERLNICYCQSCCFFSQYLVRFPFDPIFQESRIFGWLFGFFSKLVCWIELILFSIALVFFS